MNDDPDARAIAARTMELSPDDRSTNHGTITGRQTFVSALPSVSRVICVYADRGYRGRLSQWRIVITGAHCLLKVVQPVEGQKGFAVQPKRWIIERTISWLNWSRRLSKDYEQTVESSQAWIDLSAIRGNLRKITV